MVFEEVDPPIQFRVSHATRLSVVCDRVDLLVKLAWVGMTAMISIGAGVIVTLLLR